MRVWVVYTRTRTRIPDGYRILSNNVPTGRKFIPYPPLYRVIPVGYSGFGYPLPSLSPRSAAHRLKPGRHRPSACDYARCKAPRRVICKSESLLAQVPVTMCQSSSAALAVAGRQLKLAADRAQEEQGSSVHCVVVRAPDVLIGSLRRARAGLPFVSAVCAAGAIAACRRHADLQSAQPAACCPPSADPKPRQQPSTALSLWMDSNGIRTIRILFTTF
jgi:hypothetical protein